ncbi:MAG: thioredoxin fold domain-containing protein [Alphaproteobacteria bacterium]|nr:thioredoxin fold domain-containing protein [Alphaproteobacteria bacterium]QQS57617.1 MAG: thioredoxin fold domain-containing protein [Alphaproteobacteria bacterium]
MTPTRRIRRLALILATTMLTVSAPCVFAQEELLPTIPDPLKSLVNEGAQIRFLGRDEGAEGWVVIKNGVEQYFYVLPTGAFITGIMFDKQGNALTVQQVQRLRGQGDDLLDRLASETPNKPSEASPDKTKYDFKTPSEQFFYDVENSNWIAFGKAGTPVFYSFIDPQCPHCHEMMKELKPLLDEGKAQVRLIPIGFRPETEAQAAFLLAAPDPIELWWRNLDGDTNALPAKSEINTQGVQRNLSIMQAWKLSGTPTLIYRAKDESVKIIEGKPKNVQSLIGDLGARS